MATGEQAKNANARRELNELYRIYQQEIQDLSSGRNSDLGQLSLHDSLYRPGSSGLRPLGSSGSMLELHQLDSNKHSSSSKISYPLPPIGLRSEQENDRQLFMRRKRQPFRRGSEEDTHLPPLSNQTFDPRHRRANSRFSNSSSNSSTSTNERRSLSTISPLDTTSSTGESSDSIEYSRHKLKKVEEFEEPLKKRVGILPSLRLRRGQGTSSDSEVLVYNRTKKFDADGRAFSNKKIYGRKQEINEVRRTKQWTNRNGLGY